MEIQEEDIEFVEVTLSPPKSASKHSVRRNKFGSRRKRFTAQKKRGLYKGKRPKSLSPRKNHPVQSAATSNNDITESGQSANLQEDFQTESIAELKVQSSESSNVESVINSDKEEHSYFTRAVKSSSIESQYTGSGETSERNETLERDEIETSNIQSESMERESKIEKNTVACPPLQAISEAIGFLQELLPHDWTVIGDQEGFHFLQFAPCIITAVQREIYVKYAGAVSLVVHCQPLPNDHDIIRKFPETPVFKDENYKDFCQRGLLMCWEMTQYGACVGADFEVAKAIWHEIPNSFIDRNPYLETSYEITCRSYECKQIIPLRINSYRCTECSKVLKIMKGRYLSSVRESEKYSEKTSNMNLSKEQCQAKLADLQKKKRKVVKKCNYLESKIKKIEELLEKDGVDLETDTSKYFANILEKSNLTEMQQMFLDQQIKYASLSDPRSHRWHPAMIRLAIRIKTASSAAYEALRDSGAISLPHSRTLFDYTHYITGQVGVNKDLLKMFAKDVAKEENAENQYHTLIFDEMYISQNLIYRKSDGALMGYAYLDEVDKEMKEFNNFLDGKTEKEETPLAATILAFMVKGLTSNKKCVIAAYPCKDLNKNMLSARNWEVISQCEGAGVKILSVVCDGSPINRAFFKLHTPINPTESGIVYDTLNIFSKDERPLFFVSDVAHLLKTIRNGLYNSREDEGDRFRCLSINGQKMLWKTIVKLYYTYKGDTLRQCFKLNAQNVFPNSFSTMKVKYAAQVLSQTVANALKQQKWRDTEEIIRFIEMINKFFDILNGAHSSQHIRHRNPNLAPFDDPNDPRFKWLQEEFWENYLLKWKADNEKLNLPAKELGKTLLAYQAFEGIEISIKGFTAATRWLLTKGKAKFLMARAFSQDPLEQHFSLQRGALGGSTAPNSAQFLQTQITVAVQRQAKSHSKSANVEKDMTPIVVSKEPVPKRQKKRSKQKRETNVVGDNISSAESGSDEPISKRSRQPHH